MKKLILIYFLFLILPLITIGQHNLTVEIASLRNNSGLVLVELSNEKEEVIKGFSEKIVDNKCVLLIENIKPGKYAIKYFHDENKNEKLDTNFIGIPKEGYGFSNNAKGKFGPPSFEKMIFEVNQSDTIKCTPNYIMNK